MWVLRIKYKQPFSTLAHKHTHTWTVRVYLVDTFLCVCCVVCSSLRAYIPNIRAIQCWCVPAARTGLGKRYTVVESDGTVEHMCWERYDRVAVIWFSQFSIWFVYVPAKVYTHYIFTALLKSIQSARHFRRKEEKQPKNWLFRVRRIIVFVSLDPFKIEENRVPESRIPIEKSNSALKWLKIVCYFSYEMDLAQPLRWLKLVTNFSTGGKKSYFCDLFVRLD